MRERGILFSDEMRERFMAKVSPEPMSGCWLWMARVNEKGYGRFDNTTAQRAAHEIFKGPVPAGFTVDHLCRNRGCANPDHLEAVPHRVNVKRGARSLNDVCPSGHRFDARNTITRGSGHRECRACKSVRNRRDYERRVTQ